MLKHLAILLNFNAMFLAQEADEPFRSRFRGCKKKNSILANKKARSINLEKSFQTSACINSLSHK